jgi:hypothetical protein
VHPLPTPLFLLDVPDQPHLLDGPHGVVQAFLHLKDLEIFVTFLVEVMELLSLLHCGFSFSQVRHGHLIFG